MRARRATGEGAPEHEGFAVIALVDYGAGNLTSVRKALAALGAAFETPADPEELGRAAGIIVPGVGHFAATASLDGAWRSAILERVERGVPLFGVCVGMQWLFEGSDEAPDTPGLGLLKGRCIRLETREQDRLKVPHVGWNALMPPRPSRLLEGVPSASQVYFTHSYAAPVTADCVAVTTHAMPFAAAVERDRIFGVQFHPEKSADTGLQIIRNFLDVVEANNRLS
jgi:imidazole glycerol-phosphate synthase subunit HisH